MDFMFSAIHFMFMTLIFIASPIYQKVLLDTYVWLLVVGKKPYVGSLTIALLCIDLCVTTV